MNAAAAGAELLLDGLYHILAGEILLVQGKYPHFSAVLPQRPIHLRQGHRKSGGRVCALRFLDGIHLLPLGRDFRNHKA